MKEVNLHGIFAAARLLEIQSKTLIDMLVSMNWIGKGNKAQATRQATAAGNMIQFRGVNEDGMFSQARITEQGIATLKDQIARKREGIAALRAMIDKLKKGGSHV